jgi:hypothetical protein
MEESDVKTAEAENQCLICNEKVLESQDPCILHCGHSYHSDCIQQWFLIKDNTCPHCRARSNCQHPPNSQAHLKPYLFEFIAQQKETIRQNQLKIAELENLLFIQTTFGITEQNMTNNNSPGFSFQNSTGFPSFRFPQFHLPPISTLPSQRPRQIQQIRTHTQTSLPGQTRRIVVNSARQNQIRPVVYSRRNNRA